jgi:hypothetical protein
MVGYGITIASLRAVLTDRNNLWPAIEWLQQAYGPCYRPVARQPLALALASLFIIIREPHLYS